MTKGRLVAVIECSGRMGKQQVPFDCAQGRLSAALSTPTAKLHPSNGVAGDPGLPGIPSLAMSKGRVAAMVEGGGWMSKQQGPAVCPRD
jgi:hypothetical protein